MTIQELEARIDHWSVEEFTHNGDPIGKFQIVVVFDDCKDELEIAIDEIFKGERYYVNDEMHSLKIDQWDEEIPFDQVVQLAREFESWTCTEYGVGYDAACFDDETWWTLENIRAVDGRFYWKNPQMVTVLRWFPKIK